MKFRLLFAPVLILSCWSYHGRVALEPRQPRTTYSPMAMVAPLEAAVPIAAGPADKSEPPAAPAIDFKTEVQPIFVKRCSPCHFPGGSMHGKLPFDNPNTIEHLGEKVFSRIKAEDERAVIRAVLAGPGGG